ncbi:peptidylprolyl isomerase [Flavobacterium covae]|uniref:Periplasmic chaperone PpiD n=1 Tax=Flavobacterium covae TaxID=2906076 RepID=A0ABW8PHE3_9FLAO|nr:MULTISPECIES: peptidylprolyl isomerase [Flavobacterium]OWP80489.1 peptidylprolyl isomerase [Flavobacterium covae]POR21855.1 peptidylprolyl isomerase [Flavobacterium columnare]
MAVLSKIRQRSLLVAGIVGLSLFAFVIGALIENGTSMFNSRNAGTINGVDITFEDFRNKVDALQKSQQGVSFTQAGNSIWEQEIRRVLLEDQFEKTGLRIGDDQLINVIKEDPQFSQNPQFLNAAGKFDKAKFNEFLNSMKKQPESWNQWLNYEKSVAQFAKEQMYNSMIKGAYYTTQAEGKFNYELENNKVTFDLVSVPYSTIEDKKVELTDDEIVSYMKKNEKKYQAEPSRELEYVVIEDKPSVADEKAVKDKVNALMNASVVYNAKTGKNDTLAGFRSTSNVIEFVNANSDIKYDSTYIAKKDLPVDHAEALFNIASGATYGPYIFGQYYCISKSMGKKAGINAKASHILLSFKGSAGPQANRTKEEAKAKATALLAQIQANPSSFPMLAMTNSDDNSKQQGGDLGYFSKGQMTKNFENFVFGNPVGKIGLVQTEFGYHIIQVTDKQDGIRLATIAQKILPSEATSDEAFTKASKFEILANEKGFDTAVKAEKLTVAPAARVFALDENIPGVGPQREIVRWAFTADKDDVKRFQTPNAHVIAKIKSINDSGLMSIEEAKNAFGYKLRNEKKAKLIEEKMKGATLEAVAKATGSPVKEAKDVSAAGSFIESVGPEPKVVGAAFSLKTGVVSPLITGNSGVFKIKVKAAKKAAPSKDFKEVIARLGSQSKGASASRLIYLLKRDAKIEDNRAQFN